MTNKTLPEIMKEYHQLEEMMMETGEITPEIEALLDAHDSTFDEKKDRYIGLINHMKASMAEFADIKKQCDQRTKTLSNAVESMRERLLYAMQTKGLKTARGGLYPCSIAHKTTYTVDVDNIPPELDIDLTNRGWLRYDKKYDISAIKKEFADSEFVVAEDKTVLNLR